MFHASKYYKPAISGPSAPAAAACTPKESKMTFYIAAWLNFRFTFDRASKVCAPLCSPAVILTLGADKW